MKEKTDLLIINGRIYSVDRINSIYEAMAIREGKICALGKTEELKAKFSAGQIVDMHKMAVFPGFIDAHCHFFGYAMNQRYVDLNGAKSFDEVLSRLKKEQGKVAGPWLTGRGWDQNLWKEKRFPEKSELDLMFPGRPVLLIRVDGHSVLCNQAALDQTGIVFQHHFKPGEVEVKNGKLTGILSENAADFVKNMIPEPDDQVKQQLLGEAEKKCFAVGLCTVSDAGLNSDDIRLLLSMQKAGNLSIRVYAMLNPNSENLINYVNHGPFASKRLTVRSFKLYADGSLGSRTALLKSCYSDDPLKSGIQVMPTDSIKKICKIALAHGYQVNTHCIGDSAVRLILEIYGSFLKGKNDLRWRIEHAQVVDPADLHLFGDYTVIPSVQATHATSDMKWAQERIGPLRIKWAYAYKDLLDQNGWIANGTDFPIENISPLLTFYAAVARKDIHGFPRTGFQAENALTRDEALRSITIWAARANFMESGNGSLEVGKNADFVILNQDIMQIPLPEIPLTKVTGNYINGVKVL
ncbi:MAG: amidohydrolase [Bacteroidales bacterium]|nr:amidohydrolase [Bacteroidales bacterium]